MKNGLAEVGGASAPENLNVLINRPGSTQQEESSSCLAGVTVPTPPPLLPEMKGESAVTNGIRALPPRIVAAHGPTGTGKPTVFPVAVARCTYKMAKIKSSLTICAQPRRILARDLRNRIRENRQIDLFKDLAEKRATHEKVAAMLRTWQCQQQQQLDQFVAMAGQMEDGQFTMDGSLAVQALIDRWQADLRAQLSSLEASISGA